jgi:hypothetical protein
MIVIGVATIPEINLVFSGSLEIGKMIIRLNKKTMPILFPFFPFDHPCPSSLSKEGLLQAEVLLHFPSRKPTN